MNFIATQSSAAELLAAYEQQRAAGDPPRAWAALLDALHARAEHDWLDCAQAFVLRGRAGDAQQLLENARRRFPESAPIGFALAGLWSRAGRPDEAEVLLREILASDGSHAAAALLLADLLRHQARPAAAARVLRECFVPHRHGPELVIRAMELLDEQDRKADAAAIAEAEISAGCIDARIHAYAATYLIQLGEFAQAHERYLFAYANSPQAPEWEVPFGLASTQRYRDVEHADFKLFRACLDRSDLSPRARTTLLFGMGKAYADSGDFDSAARYFTQANELARTLWPWSRKQWRRSVDARVQAPSSPLRSIVDGDFVPVFVVGVPRSGTTLAAELLSRHPSVCNRGESPWIWNLNRRLPPRGKADGALLDSLATEYMRQLRQDDAPQARWFVDKQPLNLLHIGFMLAMFPNARIVYCVRGARDTALSLWMQYFREPSYGFAYDFADIAALLQGCERMMAKWRKLYPDSIHTLCYEELVAQPQASIATLNAWIGIPESATEQNDERPAAIATASIWQARQPVYTSSIGRWRAYAPFVPELLQFPEH